MGDKWIVKQPDTLDITTYSGDTETFTVNDHTDDLPDAVGIYLAGYTVDEDARPDPPDVEHARCEVVECDSPEVKPYWWSVYGRYFLYCDECAEERLGHLTTWRWSDEW